MPGQLQCTDRYNADCTLHSAEYNGGLQGDQDQFVHLWRYDGGYNAIDQNRKFLETSQDYTLIMKVGCSADCGAGSAVQDLRPLLRARESELYLQFSFWPEVELRNASHIYELRSYHLKPGTMMEWGNYWAKVSMQHCKL